MSRCPDCGAACQPGEPDCTERFHTLLALDHSRKEPWGPRHALAVAAYSLQHPSAWPREVLERSWLILYQVLVRGADSLRVTTALRRRPDTLLEEWETPPLAPGPATRSFAMTIRDLGTFPAPEYPTQLDAWCRAAFTGWGGRPRDRSEGD
jgi:hypothetical protein